MAEFIHPLACIGAVTGATGAAIYSSPGGPTPARTAAGVYTLTFAAADGFDATQKSVFCQLRGGGTANIGVAHTSDVVKTLTILDNAGMAADIDFDYVVVAGPLS